MLWAWIGLITTVVTSLIVQVKEFKPVYGFGFRRVWRFVRTNPYTVTLAVLALLGGAVAGVSLISENRGKASLARQLGDLTTQNRKQRETLESIQGHNQQLLQENRLLKSMQIAQWTLVPTEYLFVETVTPISLGNFIAEERLARSNASSFESNRSVGFLPQAATTALLPFYVGPSSEYSRYKGIIQLSCGAWPTQMLIFSSGLIDPGIGDMSQQIDKVKFGMGKFSEGTVRVFALTITHTKEVKALTLVDALRDRYARRQPLLYLQSGRPISPALTSADATRLWRRQIKDIRLTYYLDKDRHFMVHLPLRLERVTVDKESVTSEWVSKTEPTVEYREAPG